MDFKISQNFCANMCSIDSHNKWWANRSLILIIIIIIINIINGKYPEIPKKTIKNYKQLDVTNVKNDNI